MTKPQQTALIHPPSAFDDWRSIALSLYMTLVGYGVLVAIPVISAARVTLLGLSEAQAGRLSSADLGGLALGAILASFYMPRCNRRWLILTGAVLTVTANMFCMDSPNYQSLLLLRLLAGIGSGLYTAVAVANLGATSNPAKAYNLMLFAFAFSQALELHLLPNLTMNGIYAAFIGGYSLGLPLLGWIPPRAEEKQLDIEINVAETGGRYHLEHRQVPSYIVWLCLTAIFLTYINIGGYWTYIELAARQAGIAAELISQLLVWGSLFSVLGCLLATVISNRFGLARPLLLALLAMAAAVALLAFGIDSLKLCLSMLSFNLLWIFIDVYQMAFVANADHSGSFAALIPCAQGLGQIVGPNLAASLLENDFDYASVFGLCAAFALLGLITYLSVYLRLRRILPALADSN